MIFAKGKAALDHLKRRLGRLSGLWMGLFSFITFAALVAWLVFALIPAMPQRNMIMAMYPEGSASAELAKRYRAVLIRKGVDLKLTPSPGAVESVARLRDESSGTKVALIPGGITTEEASPELVSLGTLFYQPLWIFSHGRGGVLQRHRTLRGLRISIGPEGSSSRELSMKLLAGVRMFDKKSAKLLSLGPKESADKLIRGEIDLAVFFDAWESPAVQRLLKAKNVSLESLPRTDAFVALTPYLFKLVLPAGVGDMVRGRPPRDVPLMASKSSLVVRKDLHPAMQYMLLEAAVEIHSAPGMFHKADEFPAAETIDVPLSPQAREFYKSGTPFLLRHLPLWLAVFFEQPRLLVIPLLAILFPLFKVAPAIYNWLATRKVYRLYSELRVLEDEMSYAAQGRMRGDFMERLDRLRDRASHLSVPTAYKPLVYGLRSHIDMVRQEAQKVIPAM